jgi:hypothetical protein
MQSTISKVEDVIADIKRKIAQCWNMADMFLKNRDAHGLHDSCVEIQALQRSLFEIERLL